MNMSPLHKLALLAALLLVSFDAGAVEWSLKDTNGVRYSLSTLHDRWVLVNFWAPWCPSCIEELPALVSAQKQHPDLQIIGIAVMYPTKQAVTNVVQSQGISYPIVLGNEDSAGDFGGLSGLPTSFLYSPDGKLAGQHAGPLTQKDIEQVLAGKTAALFTR